MQVLIVDANPSFDRSVVQKLRTRGYDLITASDMTQALTMIHESVFDCILVDVNTPPACPSDAVAEIRQFAMTSAVVLLTSEPIQSLIEEAQGEGSIEIVQIDGAIENISRFEQPALLVGYARPAIVQRLRDEELRFSVATSLQFTINLLVDGWCQIVLLDVNIPDLTTPDKLAIFHRIEAKHLAILASVEPSGLPGITCSMKPYEARTLIALLEHTSETRLNLCGLQESSRKPRPI